MGQLGILAAWRRTLEWEKGRVVTKRRRNSPAISLIPLAWEACSSEGREHLDASVCGWSSLKSLKKQWRSECNYIQNGGKFSCLKCNIFVVSTFLELKLLYKLISPKDPPNFSLFYVGLFKAPTRPKACWQQLVAMLSFIMPETFPQSHIFQLIFLHRPNPRTRIRFECHRRNRDTSSVW